MILDLPPHPTSSSQLVGCLDAGVGAAGPELEADLQQAAADYNSELCDLESFVMQLVALTSRDAVVNSLHAVGYSTEVSNNYSHNLAHSPAISRPRDCTLCALSAALLCFDWISSINAELHCFWSLYLKERPSARYRITDKFKFLPMCKCTYGAWWLWHVPAGHQQSRPEDASLRTGTF